MEAEAAPSMEAQLQALRSQGPPPGMSPEDFEKEMAQYEQAMQDPAVRPAAQLQCAAGTTAFFCKTDSFFMFHATSWTTLSSKMRSCWQPACCHSAACALHVQPMRINQHSSGGAVMILHPRCDPLLCADMHACLLQKRRQMEEMQAMAAQPQVQEQMAQMAAVMQNTALMERMEQLKVRSAGRGPLTLYAIRRKHCSETEHQPCMTAESSLAARTPALQHRPHHRPCGTHRGMRCWHG